MCGHIARGGLYALLGLFLDVAIMNAAMGQYIKWPDNAATVGNTPSPKDENSSRFSERFSDVELKYLSDTEDHQYNRQQAGTDIQEPPLSATMPREHQSLQSDGEAVIIAAEQAEEPRSSNGDNINISALRETLLAVLQTNPTLLAIKHTAKAAQFSETVSRAPLLPRISAFSSYSDIETKVSGQAQPDLYRNSHGLTITQEIAGGRNYFTYKRAKSNTQQQNLRRIQAEQDVFLQAITVYFDVVRDRAILQFNENNRVVLEKQLQAAIDRFEVGVATRTDVAQSQARLAEANSLLLAAQTQLQSSTALFISVVGQPPGNLSTTEQTPVLPNDVDEAIRIAYRMNPELREIREAAQASKYDVYARIGEALPTISLQGRYTKTDNPSTALINRNSETTELMATLNVPLFSGGRSVGAVRTAKEQASAVTQNIFVTSRNLTSNVTSLWHRYISAGAAIGAREEQIKASQIALAGVVDENKVGIRTTLDVLDAERALLDARVGLVGAKRDHMVAAYSLLRSIGGLTRKALEIE